MNQNFNHTQYSEQLWSYALGLLEGGELNSFKAHLSSCLECQKETLEAEQTVARLAYSTPPSEPPTGLKQRVLGNLGEQDQVAYRVAPRKTWWPRLAFGFGVVALLLAFLGWNRASELNRQLAALRQELATLRSQIVQYANQLALLRSPASEIVILAGQPISPQSKGKMIWDATTKSGVFLAAGLPTLPEDKIYQLWVIADNHPISAGIFSVDQAGNVELEVKELPDSTRIQAFAVTIEPAGGVPQPTGEKYLIGAFSRI